MPASPSDASLAELSWLGVHDRSVDETCDSEDAEGTVRLPAPAGGRTPLKNIWPRQTPQATPRGRPNAAAKGAAPAAATPASLLPRRTPSRRTSADSSDEEETWSDASSHSAGTIARHSRYASAMSTLRLAGARRRAEAAARAAAGEATILVGPAGVDVARWVRAGGAATQAAAPPSLPDTRRAKATSRDAEAGASRQPSLQQPLPSPAPARVASPPPAAPVARDEQPSPAQGLQDHGEQATSATTPHAPDHSAEDDVEAALAELDADMIATLLREVDGEGSADPAGKEAPDRAATSTYGGGMPDETVRSDLAIDAASPADALVAQYNADDTSQQLVGGSDVREGYSVSDVQVPAASPSRQSLGAADRDEPQPEPQPEARRVEDTSKASQLRAPAPGGRSARALYDFAGEATFNELSLKAGQCFEILVPELRGGWSLGRVMLPHEGGGLVERRGLVPLGWYCVSHPWAGAEAGKAERAPGPQFIQDFAAAPGDSSEGAPSAEADDQLSVLRAPAARDSTAVPAYAKAMRPPDEDAKQRPASGVGEFHRKGAAPAIKTLEALHGSYDAADTRASLLSRHAASAPASDGLGSDLIDHRVPVSSSPLLSSPPTPTLVVDGAQDGSPDGASGSTAPPVAAPATGSSFLSASWRGAGLLGGRSFNRFSPFVVSGAEAFILSRSAPAPPGHARASAVRSAAPGQLDKSSAEASGSRRGARHVDADLPRISDSLHGPQWEPRAPPYHVVVHSPEPRWDANGAEYTVYAVTSLFGNADTDADSTTWRPYDPAAAPVNPDETLSVWRRFSHFHWLSMYIARALPLLSLSLPPPPAKVLAGRTRLEPDFVETRRRELGAWLTRVARHPVLRTEPGLVFFLGCADEHTWNARAPGLLAQAGKAGGYSFFAATCHDQWAFDASEADEAAQRLDEFNGAYERSMGGHRHGLLESFAAGREALAKTSGAYRAVGHGLLRLTTGFGGSHASGADASASAEDEAYFGPAMGGLGERGQSGATNEDGAWCWRPDCAGECRFVERSPVHG
jgi:hypothetical protein